MLAVVVAVASVGFVSAVGVASMTGRLAYAVTTGMSMEPTYHAGDFVIVAPAQHYRTGDVVAYRGPATHRVVLHRVIAGDDRSGFVMKGDNNSSADPDRPLRSDLLGRVVLHIRGVSAIHNARTAREVLATFLIFVVGIVMLRDPQRAQHRRPTVAP
ncbi:MAG: signal peptidase I [Acidimicrobiales bacterium]